MAGHAKCVHCGGRRVVTTKRDGWFHCQNCQRKFLMRSKNPTVLRQYSRTGNNNRARKRARMDEWIEEQAAKIYPGEYGELKWVERNGGPKSTELGSSLQQIQQLAEMGVLGPGQRHTQAAPQC